VTELGHSGESMRDVEAAVRAAGNYIQPSRDLRPRVLETARALRTERRAQRHIKHMAVLVVLLGVFSASSGYRLERDQAVGPRSISEVEAKCLFPPANLSLTRGAEIGWAIVEAFTEVRRQQAEVLHPD
jgi:hypothetical protein